MSVDASQINSSATTNVPSVDQGSVAPPQSPHGYRVIPEGEGSAAGSQPAAQPNQTPASPPEIDYRAQLEQERQLRQQQEQQNQQYQQAFQQIQQGVQQQTMAQQEAQERAMILAQAESMGTEDANRFLNQQMALRDQRKNQQAQMALQQQQEQIYQRDRIAMAVPYGNDLAEKMGLSPEAKEELLELGDADLMWNQVQAIKRRDEKWKQKEATLTTHQQQLARSTEVTALRQNGLAQMGGQNGGGSWQLEVSDDPDERAMQILAAQQNIERYGEP